MKIEIRNASKVIQKAEVLKDINIHFEGGKIYGLRGKNGSGKTMLMRAISGLITLTTGEVVIDGRILGKDMSFPESIGILIENPSFIDSYTGYQNLKALADINHRIASQEICEVLEQVGLNPADKKKYKKYSLGMKQRLGIAAAIMEKPQIILLDEPINALDESGVEQIRNALLELKNDQRIIIVACHDREELDLLSDEIIELQDGAVVNKYYN
ncbi:ATP-binding cassette domain-containing protein [Agathobacter ruminis]|uniref:Multidrug ABC transporter ATP-binding protein n=1 Tax=Agathobacter ruminis TaxID=1712665 RepID=A0A2G3E417_9FIRM|nr:ATP-binding cassette domain-containing protein [Agathobacter ruminis]MDC7302253.1 ATP-binding cassette domain-containing protein [Agathobacter ruminis]PHU37900.1 multidrug ABC transporter ATP-binding protein [Agathobacter ruminis]